MKFLKAANKILVVRFILLAHRLPVPIEHCLIAGLRCVGLGQLLGNSPIAVLAGRVVVVAHRCFGFALCLLSSRMTSAASTCKICAFCVIICCIACIIMSGAC